MLTAATRFAVVSFLAVLLFPAVVWAQTSPAPNSSKADPAAGATAPQKSEAAAQKSQAPAIVKLTPAIDYSKEPYVIELLQQKLRFEADGKGQRELTLRVRIQSESAVREFGLLVYPFASSFEALEVAYARVRKPDGTVIETPASDVQELDSAVSREAPMYTDQREKHVAIKALSPGDILEVKFVWTVHDPIAPGHFWFDKDYFKAGICLKETLEVNVPTTVPVKVYSAEAQPAVREEGDRRIYTIETANLKKQEESKIPDWERNFYGLKPPDVRVTSFATWEEVGEWFGVAAKPKAAPDVEIRAKAEELTKGKTSDEEKIRALYDFVSTRIRYIGVDLGVGRYTPHAAADVLTNRYGDCKDKHTLFAALLQAKGFAAYPVLISSRYKLDATFPSPDLFDHVITAIPKGDGVLFLDTTPEVAPYGLLMSSLRDRQTLVIPADKPARLVTTPAEPPFPFYETFHIDSTIDDKGTLDAKMLLEERSDSEVVLRSAYRTTPQNQWEDLTQKLVARLGYGGKVSDVSVAAPEDTSKPFTIAFTYHRTDYPDWKNHRIVLPVPPFFLTELTEEQKSSKERLPIGTPTEVTYDTTVKLPDGYTAVTPLDLQDKSDIAEFSASYALNKENVLHGTLRLKMLAREIPGTERAKFSALSEEVEETPRRFIFVGGDFPSDKEVQSGLPRQLKLLTAPTIESLEKKVDENPADLRVRLILGRAYVANGRAKDAVALYLKALELAEDPDNSGQLYYAMGQAYAALPDDEKAFASFEKALTEHATPDQFNTAAWALGDVGLHLKESLEWSQRAVTTVAKQTMDISADDAGVSEFALMGELAAYWDTLGWIKFKMGDNAAAERYLRASWELGQFPIVGEHLAEVYEKLGETAKAATICNMAAVAVGPGRSDPKIEEEMGRLRPYLKPQPGHRGPVDGSMALSDLRVFTVPYQAKLANKTSIAHFTISIVNGPRADNVIFDSGAAELRNAVATLASAKYPQSFPDETRARVIRKATLSCSVYTKGCVVVLMPIGDAAVPEH